MPELEPRTPRLQPSDGAPCAGPALPALLQASKKLKDWQKAPSFEAWLRSRWRIFVPALLLLVGFALSTTGAILGWRGEPREAVRLAGVGVALMLSGLTVAVQVTDLRWKFGCSVSHGLCRVLGMPLDEAATAALVVGGAWALGIVSVACCARRCRA
jgi:hypothetical protein